METHLQSGGSIWPGEVVVRGGGSWVVGMPLTCDSVVLNDSGLQKQRGHDVFSTYYKQLREANPCTKV